MLLCRGWNLWTHAGGRPCIIVTQLRCLNLQKKKEKNDRGWTTRVRSHRHLILQSPYFLKKCNDLSTFYRNYDFTHNNKIHYKNTKIPSPQMHYSNKFFQTRRKISSIGIKFHPFPFN